MYIFYGLHRVIPGKDQIQHTSAQKHPLHESNTKSTVSPRETASRDCYDSSAFRPIAASKGTGSLSNGGPVVKPKAMKMTSSEDTDSGERTLKLKKTKPPRKRVLDKHKSSSMHNLTESSSHDEGSGVVKAKSDKDLTKSSELSYASTGIDVNGLATTKYSASFSAPKPRVIYVQSNSVIESVSNHSSPQTVQDPFTIPELENTPVTSQSCMQLNRYDSDPNSSLTGTKWDNLRVDADKPRGLRVVRTQSSVRQDSVSSESSAQSAQQARKVYNAAHGTNRTNESSDTPTAVELPNNQLKVEEETEFSVNGEWIHRGAVVYYHAEMEGNLRTDVKDFASQMVSFENNCLILQFWIYQRFSHAVIRHLYTCVSVDIIQTLCC